MYIFEGLRPSRRASLVWLASALCEAQACGRQVWLAWARYYAQAYTRQSCRSRPSAKIKQATQILTDFLWGNAVVFWKRGCPSVSKSVRNFIQNRPKMEPRGLPDPPENLGNPDLA